MKKMALFVLFALLFGSAVSGEVSKEIQTQTQINALIKSFQPQRLKFIKDRPIPGLVLTVSSFSGLPGVVQKYLGQTDATKYTDEYIVVNRGSIVALQMDGDKPDFYIIGIDTYTNKYSPVPLEDVARKNAKLWKALNENSEVKGLFADYAEKKVDLVGALKTQPVAMIKMSDIGYLIQEEILIQSPWGGQTKPAGQDAYLTYDDSKQQFYMVNVDEKGLPIGYIPSK